MALTPSKGEFLSVLHQEIPQENILGDQMDNTTTGIEKRLWDETGYVPETPWEVIDRPNADEVGFRGWIENLTTQEVEDRIIWLMGRAIPGLNPLEEKVILRVLELRRELGLYLPEIVRKEKSLSVDALEKIIAKALAKFRLHENSLVLNQIVE